MPTIPAPTDPLLDITFAGFGTDGKVITTGPSCCVGDMALQRDGNIVVVGNGGMTPDVLVMRYLSNGTLDPSFGDGGTAVLSYRDYALTETSVAVQQDGKIIVAGALDDHQWNPDFFLIRLTSTGEWDQAFGTGGIATTNFGKEVGGDDEAMTDIAEAVLIQPDGKIVVAGTARIDGDYDFAVARYNPDGSLDSTFGDWGGVTIGFGSDDHASDIAIQEDGKLVMVGHKSGWFGSDFAVARLNSDGTRDNDFDGDGELTTGFGGNFETAYGVAIQPDGKIVVVGDNSAFNYSDDALVARYWRSDGELDDSFDGDGKRKIGSLSGKINDVAIQPDGKIMLLGWHASPNGDIKFAFYRLNADSSLDKTFDGDGRAFVDIGGDDYGAALALQPDGRIIGYGSTDNNHALVRLWPDGSFDTGGQQALGFIHPNFGPGTDETAYAMAIQPDGKVVLAGEVRHPASLQSKIGLARFLPDGQLDTSFGDQGQVFSGLGEFNVARALAIQPDGKIVVAGSIDPFGSTQSNFIVARFNPNGSPDGTFSFFGFNVVDFMTGSDSATAVGLAPDGKIVVAGTVFNGVQMVFGVARFNSNGILDSSFDGDGKQFVEFAVNTVHEANAVVVQPDHKIVVAGQVDNNFALVRLNEDGSRDSTGGAVHDMGGRDEIKALVLKPDGGFVAAGTRSVLGVGSDIALAQYTPNGLPSSGNAGNPWGKAILDWSVNDRAFAIDMRSDGQAVVAGCVERQFAVVVLPTNVSTPPNPTPFTTGFPENNECLMSVNFLGLSKVIAAGHQEFNGDRNMALVRFDLITNLGLRDPLQSNIDIPEKIGNHTVER